MQTLGPKMCETMSTEPMNCCARPIEPPFLARIGKSLFPRRNYAELPESPKGQKAEDVLVCRVTCSLSIADRIRIFFSGRLEVRADTVTENRLGWHSTATACNVLPPKFLSAPWD